MDRRREVRHNVSSEEAEAQHRGRENAGDVDADRVHPFAGQADIAVRLTRPTSGDLTSVKLAEDPSVVAASAPLAALLGALRALEDAPWIAWDASLGHLPDARWVATA